MNKLCRVCQDIFRGYWVPRPEDSPDIEILHAARSESPSSSPEDSAKFEGDNNVLEPEDETENDFYNE
jgi:hypothetical protein